jgi:hypothetical protein
MFALAATFPRYRPPGDPFIAAEQSYVPLLAFSLLGTSATYAGVYKGRPASIEPAHEADQG